MITLRQIYEALNIELNKENTPNILLEDFNHFVNKTVYLYCNKRYNLYDVNLQTTDDLRALKTRAKLIAMREGEDYYVELPSDYYHLLNCLCNFEAPENYKCYREGATCSAAATKLTADTYNQILDNYWFKPSYERPYYYICNDNIRSDNPTNPYTSDNPFGTDAPNVSKDENKRVRGHLVPLDWTGKDTISLVTEDGVEELNGTEKAAGIRYGNPSRIKLEIKCGSRKPFELKTVIVEYLKTPQHLKLTQKQLDMIEDYSLVLEFPDYVCQEILNELVHIIMEHSSDARLQTHPVVSLSIANPTQTLTPTTEG